MVSESRVETPLWFVLNHIGIAFQDMARKAIDRFNAGQKCNLELFAPTYVVKEEKDGEIKMKTVNLTFHYVFVRGTLPEVKTLCGQNNGFSFLIDHGNLIYYFDIQLLHNCYNSITHRLLYLFCNIFACILCSVKMNTLNRHHTQAASKNL